MPETKIDPGKTYVSLQLMVAACVAAISWGVLFQKVQSQGEDLASIKTQLIALNQKVDNLSRSTISVRQ